MEHLTPEIVTEAMSSRIAIMEELRPCTVFAGPDQSPPLLEAISTYAALALALSSISQKEEFIVTAMKMLHKYPESLIVPAIHGICEDRIRPFEFVAEAISRISRNHRLLLSQSAAVGRLIDLSGC